MNILTIFTAAMFSGLRIYDERIARPACPDVVTKILKTYKQDVVMGESPCGRTLGAFLCREKKG